MKEKAIVYGKFLPEISFRVSTCKNTFRAGKKKTNFKIWGRGTVLAVESHRGKDEF